MNSLLSDIPGVNFDRKLKKCVGVLIFITENQMSFYVFFIKSKIFEDKGFEMNIWANFWTKVIREKAHLLKLESYICRKMRKVTRRIITSVVTTPNLIHFRPKIGFKSQEGSFTSFGRHLRTKNINMHGHLELTKFEFSTYATIFFSTTELLINSTL